MAEPSSMRVMNTAFQESESGSALSPLNKARNDSATNRPGREWMTKRCPNGQLKAPPF